MSRRGERPALLVVDPITERRRTLSHALATSYEVVPAVDAAEGQLYAHNLGPAVVVMPASLARSAGGWAFAEAGDDQTLVLLGSGDPSEEEDFPDHALLLPAHGLAREDLIRKIRLVLLAREAGIESDVRFEALIGDLTRVPLLELVQVLSRMRLSARLELVGRGAIRLDGGQLHSARAGNSDDLKAFCRLGRLTEGPLRVTLEDPPPGESSLPGDLSSALVLAIEDSLGDYPPPGDLLSLSVRDGFFETSFNRLQRDILAYAHRQATVQETFDGIAETDGTILREMISLEDAGFLLRETAPTALHVMTDSTSDLPPDLAAEHGIEIVPLTVHLGGRSFKDRVDLQPGSFYELLPKTREHPTTEPPPRQEFARRFAAQPESRQILSLHISSALSETYRNARSADRPGDSAAVIDSRLVSMPLGLLTLFAARLALRGFESDVIVRRVRAMAPRFHTFFVVDTLDYLARGGRIGKARALLGSLLNIKPILGLEDGQIVPVARVRGGRQAHPKILELLRASIDPARPVIAGIAHSSAPVWADRLRSLIHRELEVQEFVIGDMGPVVGAHVGPGTVGATLFQPSADEATDLAPLSRDT
ncbi:MAG: DegV family protein [Acidobacteriota bacterium]